MIIKGIINADVGFLKAPISGNGHQPVVEGALDAYPSSTHDLLLNLALQL